MVALGLLSAVAVWRVPGLVVLGRSSLGVYVAHLVVLYGWAGTDGLALRWARDLSAPVAMGLAVLVLGLAVGIARGGPTVLAWLEARGVARISVG